MRRLVPMALALALIVAACGDDGAETTVPGQDPGGVAPTEPTTAPQETTAPTDAPPATGGPLYDEWARLGEAAKDWANFDSAEAWSLIPDSLPVEEAWGLGSGFAWAVEGCHAGFEVTKSGFRESDEPPYVLRDDYDEVVAWLISEAEGAGWSVTTSAWESEVVGFDAVGTILLLTGQAEPWMIRVIDSEHSIDIGYCPAG